VYYRAPYCFKDVASAVHFDKAGPTHGIHLERRSAACTGSQCTSADPSPSPCRIARGHRPLRSYCHSADAARAPLHHVRRCLCLLRCAYDSRQLLQPQRLPSRSYSTRAVPACICSFSSSSCAPMSHPLLLPLPPCSSSSSSTGTPQLLLLLLLLLAVAPVSGSAAALPSTLLLVLELFPLHDTLYLQQRMRTSRSDNKHHRSDTPWQL
jgi:hypothetical protein